MRVYESEQYLLSIYTYNLNQNFIKTTIHNLYAIKRVDRRARSASINAIIHNKILKFVYTIDFDFKK